MSSKDSQDRSIRDVVFGAQQRRLRTMRGISVSELARELGYSDDLIRKIENGIRRARPEYVVKADEVLDVHGVLVAAAEELEQLTLHPEWFEEYVDTEATARRIEKYDVAVLPGLLQTDEYAFCVLNSRFPTLDEDEVESRVRARIERQAVLTHKPTCIISFVIEEWVLRRRTGGSEVARRQLQRLIECAEMRNVSIQVMPIDTDTHPGFDGPLTILETEDEQRVAYIEYQNGGLWVCQPAQVGVLEVRYGMIRAQALSPSESLRLMKKLEGEL